MGRLFSEDEVRAIIAEATAPLLARIADLEAEVKRLQAEVARLKKDSSTSSKPPSSDIVKPPRPEAGGGRRKKRRRGGQPGHERHQRPPYPPEEVDRTRLYECSLAELGAEWKPLEQFRVMQQVDLVEKPFVVVEHRARLYRSRRTGEIVAAPLPKHVVAAGLVGPRLSALIAYLKGGCHVSIRSLQTLLADVFHLPLSTGQVAKILRKASSALETCHLQLRSTLPGQSRLNVDETGHPECGQRLWAWCFHAPGPAGFSWFHIDAARSSEVLQEFLGETFHGILGCDYFSAYRKFLAETNVVMQFCWAHLVRDVKFLTTLTDMVTRRFGEKLLAEIKSLFRLWHRRATVSTPRWQRATARAKAAILAQARHAPRRSEAQNIAERFQQHGRFYFTFLDAPGVEPTNNAAERAIRFQTIDRKITQGTRGEIGRRWCERIWTVLATCRQQGRSAFEFLHQSILALFARRDPPSLLTEPPNP